MASAQMNAIPPQPEPEEQIVWEGGPALLTGLPRYLLTVVVVALAGGAKYFLADFPWAWMMVVMAAALIPALWTALRITSVRYRLTTERLITARGIFLRRTDELELYRVKDMTLMQPLWARLLGKGNVVLYTSDLTSPTLTLAAIADARQVFEHIRKNVEVIRQRKGVREIDVE